MIALLFMNMMMCAVLLVICAAYGLWIGVFVMLVVLGLNTKSYFVRKELRGAKVSKKAVR